MQWRKRKNKTRDKIEYIWTCLEARKEIKREWVEGVDKWKANLQDEAWTRLVIDTLKELPRIDIGGFARDFEKLIKEQDCDRRNG